MKKFKLSNLLSAKEYKDIELDFRIVEKILNKTIYADKNKSNVTVSDLEIPKKRTSIVRRAVLYIAPVTAVIMIFVLYQGFFTEVKDAQELECKVTGGVSGGGFSQQASPECITVPGYNSSKDKTVSDVQYDGEEEISHESMSINNVMEESDDMAADNAMLKSSNPEFDPEYEDSDTDNDEGGLEYWDYAIDGNEVPENNKVESSRIFSQENIASSSVGKGGGMFDQKDAGTSGVIGGGGDYLEKDYTMYYIGGGIGIFILILIIYVILRNRKNKKINE